MARKCFTPSATRAGKDISAVRNAHGDDHAVTTTEQDACPPSEAGFLVPKAPEVARIDGGTLRRIRVALHGADAALIADVDHLIGRAQHAGTRLDELAARRSAVGARAGMKSAGDIVGRFVGGLA